MPNYSDIENTDLEAPVIVRVFTRVAFVSFTQSGVQKRIMTNRRGLEYLRDEIDKSLANPLSNQNGVTIRDGRSNRGAGFSR